MLKNITNLVLTVEDKHGNTKTVEVSEKPAKNKRKVKTWSPEEDQLLLSLYEKHPKNWTCIAQKMPDRNENQCLHRFRRLSQTTKENKIWSNDEDETVLRLVKKFGKNWKMLSEKLGTKSGKQIRERYINKLDPNIKSDHWTEQEDLKLIELYLQMGTKWSEIAKKLPGRPENRIKNRFYSFIKRNYNIKESAGDQQNKATKTAQKTGTDKNITAESTKELVHHASSTRFSEPKIMAEPSVKKPPARSVYRNSIVLPPESAENLMMNDITTNPDMALSKNDIGPEFTSFRNSFPSSNDYGIKEFNSMNTLKRASGFSITNIPHQDFLMYLGRNF